MRRLVFSAVCAGLVAGVAQAQPMQLDPEGFGSVPVSGQQALVSMASDLGPGFVPAKRFTRAPIRPVADATGFLDLKYAHGGRNACTAVLIAPTILMTNAHCVPQTGPERVINIVFQTGFEDSNRTRRVEFLRVDPTAIEFYPAPIDAALLRLIDRSERVAPIRFDIADPLPDESLFIVGHPLAASKQVSTGACFAANEPLNGDTVLHTCNTHEGSSGSFIVSNERRNTVIGLHKWGAKHGARYNMGTRMTEIASISPEFSKVLGQEFVPSKPKPPQPVAENPISMVEACDRYAAHPYNPDNPPGIVGVDWDDLIVTDAIAICDAALKLLPKHDRANFNLARAHHKNGQYDEARRLLERGVDRDYAAAYHNLAALYAGGLGVEVDLDEAGRLYERAADLGHAVSALQLGDMYRDARGKPQDYDKAMAYYRKAYEGGYAEGAAKIGWMIGEGKGVPKDMEGAISWYKIAAQSDVAWAINNLGHAYLEQERYALAKQNFEHAIVLGYETYPNRNMGLLYENGWGVPRDYDKAEAHYLAADAAGHSTAKRLLGDLYRDRDDSKRDPQQALSYYEESVKSGDKEGLAKIGHLYARRHIQLGSDEETYKAAVDALEKAVAEDIAWSKRELGRLYRYGRGVPEDKARAVALFREAMDKDRNAKIRLADMYLRGEGVPVDGKRALRMLEEVEAEDDDWARGKLIALLSRVPAPDYVIDPKAYEYGNRTKAEQKSEQLEDVNFTLAWAQIIGAVKAPIPETEGYSLRLARLSALMTKGDANGHFETTARKMHDRARALLAVHLDDLEARPEDGWLWGGLPHVGGPDMMQVLFGAEFNDKPLSAKDINTRNRLLVVEARRSAKNNPEGPQVYTNGRSQNMTVRETQTLLTDVGFKPGIPDGKVGPATRRALSGFQRALGLEPTGQPDAVTLFALRRAKWNGFRF
jgi:TPR repeat protein